MVMARETKHVSESIAQPYAGISDEREKEISETLAKEQRARDIETWNARKDHYLSKGLSLRHLELAYSRNWAGNPACISAKRMGKEGLFIMSGNVGCGKTQAAHLWLLEAFEFGQAQWRHSSQMRLITAAWFARTSRYDRDTNKFDMLARVPFLVIDDLGVEFADKGGSLLVDLDELLNTRWEAKTATLLLTNIGRTKFKERYKKRIYDRARGDGRWFDAKFTSMRGDGMPEEDGNVKD